ncbi:bestrophin family protein [Fibrella arboris]|uniref:bestrophin family protein n=1 Tax=Fibrella arboris TaxID=3242486 RepID=UPI00351F9F21
MITYSKNDWFSAIWHFHASPTAFSLFRRLFWVALYVTGVTFLELWVVDLRLKDTPTEFLSTMGILLSLLLLFRTNTAYDRFYEGRRAWGTLVNNSRNLAAYLNAVIPTERTEDRLFYTKMIANFAFSLENHLRNDIKSDGLEPAGIGELSELTHYDHVPNGVVAQLQVRTERLYREGLFTDAHLINLSTMLLVFLDVAGICERIKSTPIPFSYSFFIKVFILMYIFVMPFIIIDEYGYLTIPAVVAMSYILVGLELIGEEIQNPFGIERNNLPLNQISKNIRLNVHELMQFYIPHEEKQEAKAKFVIVT